MLCEKCKERDASIHMTKIINGEKIEQHLCEICMKEQKDYGNQSHTHFNMDLQTFLSKLFDISFQNVPTDFSKKNHSVFEEKSCEFCGMTLGEFRQKGKFGCAHCYGTFRDSIGGLVKKLHGNQQHGGKVPQRAGADLRIKRKVQELRKQLNQAVEKEEYELAAKLRDQIREMEGGEAL